MIQLPADFKEFLKLLNSHGVEYLVVGGIAVAFHGYPRATGDLDIWIAANADTADRLIKALADFGFSQCALSPDLFLKEGRIIRMGVPPFRIEVMTGIAGVRFDDCHARRVIEDAGGVDAPIISLQDLKINKRAAGRLKDLNDIQELETRNPKLQTGQSLLRTNAPSYPLPMYSGGGLGWGVECQRIA